MWKWKSYMSGLLAAFSGGLAVYSYGHGHYGVSAVNTFAAIINFLGALKIKD